MEEAARIHDTRKLYRLLREANGKACLKGSDTLKESDGRVISDEDRMLERWKEHFDDLLNHPPPSSFPDEVMQAWSQLPHPRYSGVSEEPPTINEVSCAIRSLKGGRAAGEDSIPPEVIKAGGAAMERWMHRLICVVWEKERVPADWQKAVVLPMHKKGDTSVCGNYRGISLIDVTCKVFTAVLLNRFRSERDPRIRPQQAGFRPGRGCVDQIFTLRHILEQRSKYQQKTYICFIDFKAAFDSIHRDSLWTLMSSDGVPPKLLRLMQEYYSSTSATVRLKGQESTDFEVKTGVRQGCILSPPLFNYVVDYTLSSALREHRGVAVGENDYITDLDYADDVALLAESERDLQAALDRIHMVAEGVGLKINPKKTKCLVAPAGTPCSLSLNGEQIEQVDRFVYLGSTFTDDLSCTHEVHCRIGKASSAFNQLYGPLWSRGEISITTKKRVYEAVVRSVLLYGAESWTLSTVEERALSAFDHICMRRILGVSYLDRVSNLDIRERIGIRLPAAYMIQERRMRWFGHVLRRENTFIAQLALRAHPPRTWRRPQGGQRKTWVDKLKDDVATLSGPGIHGLRRWNSQWLDLTATDAADRRLWRAMVRDTVEASLGRQTRR